MTQYHATYEIWKHYVTLATETEVNKQTCSSLMADHWSMKLTQDIIGNKQYYYKRCAISYITY